jgi:hypothetical protein
MAVLLFTSVSGVCADGDEVTLKVVVHSIAEDEQLRRTREFAAQRRRLRALWVTRVENVQ